MVNVIGLGYIGLPTALILAKSGIDIVGTDIDQALISLLSEGTLSFMEEGLDELFDEAIKNGIKFTTEYQESDCYIIAVPTPFESSSKKIDMRYVLDAVNKVMDVCKKGALVIIESTLSPGAIDRYVRPRIKNRGMVLGVDINLVHAPERVIPGRMIYELKHNARIIGVDDPEVGERVKGLYARFCRSEIIITDIKTAEMSKVVENTYRDINIAYANELAKICRVTDMDVYEIIRIANKHPRVNILQPGPGVGGHCISVDPWFLVGDYPDLTNLILAARKVNDSMPVHVLGRIRDIMRENNISDPSQIGLYGLTYKENISDTRESPTLQLLKRMDEHLAYGVKVYDPFIKTRMVEHQFVEFKDFLNEIKVLVIMIAHDHIKNNMSLIKDKIILDTKNICKFGEGVYRL